MWKLKHLQLEVLAGMRLDWDVSQPLLRKRSSAPSSQVKNYSPGYVEQAPSSGHEASL